MSVKFFNIRTGEQRIVSNDPVFGDAHIAALWSSSDRSPNITQGQDFGWRLAPETVVEIERIQNTPRLLESIAVKYGVLPDNVTESTIIAYISEQNSRKTQGLDQNQEDFKRQYEEDIRSLRESGQSGSSESIKHEEPPVDQPSGTITPDGKPVESETPSDQPEEPSGPETQEEAPTAPELPETSKEEPQDSEGEKEDKAPEPTPPEQIQPVDNSMSRAQLETIAKDAGVDAPSSFANKGDLVKAIDAKRTA